MKHKLKGLVCPCGPVVGILAASIGAFAPPDVRADAGGYGLETPEPVAVFWNGVFPASTPGENGAPQPPARLSETNTFSSLAALEPAPGLIPYEVNSPLWTDGARKRRWIAVPNNGTHNSESERIGFSMNDFWTFPIGTVLVKHFELPTDRRNPDQVRRAETRFLVHGATGYYGVTYRWRPDHSDADLLLDGQSESIVVTGADGSVASQTWSYPSREDCMGCHNSQAGYVLGPRTHQLNGAMFYPQTGRTDNQLRALNHLGIFSPAIAEAQLATYPKSYPLSDMGASVESRVRSYLDSNCSHCHRPGVTNAFFDTRYHVPLEQQGIIGGELLYDQGIPGGSIVTPQSVGQSIMHLRMSSLGIEQMPPVGKNVIHADAVALLEEWINALSPEDAGGNRPPVAVDDAALTAHQMEVEIDLLQNDSDPDGDPLDVMNLTQPANGTVVANGDGSVIFGPDGEFSGDTVFTYQVEDGNGGVSRTATVTVTVAPRPTSTGLGFVDGTSRFTNPNIRSGVAIGVADMNGDGRDDVVRLHEAKMPLIELQQVDGTFVRGYSGIPYQIKQWALALADVNGDGRTDFATGGYQDGLKVFQANSSGSSWSPSTLTSPVFFPQAVNFVDIDNDGFLDLFACNDDGENLKFRGNGAGGFVLDHSLIDTTAPPSDHSGNYGSTWTDYDGDGDLDLYLSKCRAAVSSPSDPRRINKLLRQNADGTFAEAGPEAGLDFGEQSWAADFGDVDNDGDLDCFVGNHHAPSYLMLNDGDGTFTNVTAASGINANFLVIQVAFRDFDNDGWVDLLLTGKEQHLYLNDSDGTFTRTGNLFTASVIESCAVGDLNHDGFVDVYAGYAKTYNTPSTTSDRLFLNSGNDHHWLAVQLEGTTSNRQGIGARVEITGEWGTQVREVRAGESYGVSYSRTAHFGLGAFPGAAMLRVLWPSGTVDSLNAVSGNRYLKIREGSTLPPAIHPIAAQRSVAGDSVGLPVAASDPTGDSLTFSAVGLPPGLSIHPVTGWISGQLSEASIGEHSGSIAVSDGFTSVSTSLVWVVDPDVSTWSQWSQYTPGAGSSPAANTDGDVFDDLQEFYFGSDPARSAQDSEGLVLNASPAGVSASYLRKKGLSGVTAVLQTCQTFGNWANTSVTPVISDVAPDRQLISFPGLDAVPGSSAGRGFVRLKILLTSPIEAVTYTLPLGWRRTVVHPGRVTHGNPFAKKSVFSSRIASSTGSTVNLGNGGLSGRLDSDGTYYVEFVTGPMEGHRFDLDASASGDSRLVLAMNSEHNTSAALLLGNTLLGSRVLVRPHTKLGEVYPPGDFIGGLDSSAVDQIQFFTGQGYDSLFLVDMGNGTPPYWTNMATAALADEAERVVPPGAGCFLQKTGSSATVLTVGEVRTNRFVQPLRVGLNLISEPCPVDQSPASRRLLLEDGFTGSANPAEADQILRWRGNEDPSQAGFASYFLLDLGSGSPLRYWTGQATAALANENATVLFRADRAVFLRMKAGMATYYVPAIAYP